MRHIDNETMMVILGIVTVFCIANIAMALTLVSNMAVRDFMIWTCMLTELVVTTCIAMKRLASRNEEA